MILLGFLTALTILGCSGWLAYFFGRQWRNPVFRALAIRDGALGAMYGVIVVGDYALDLAASPWWYAVLRPNIFRTVYALALVYLVLALRKSR